MKLVALSISDRVLGHFNPPMFARNQQQLFRELREAYKRRESLELPAYIQVAFDNPKDNAVFMVGTFDDATGGFERVNTLPQQVFTFEEVCVTESRAVNPQDEMFKEAFKG